MRKKITHTWVLETYASQDPIVVVAAPPAVAASLGGVIPYTCLLVVAALVVVRAIVWAVHVASIQITVSKIYMKKTHIPMQGSLVGVEAAGGYHSQMQHITR